MLRRMRLLFVGDSVTAGFGVVAARAFPRLVGDRLADRGLAIDVVVDALEGSDSAYVLRRFDRMVTSHDPDWVALALGLNDARPPQGRPARTPGEFEANMTALVDRVASIGARPLLIAPTPRFDAPEPPRGDGSGFEPGRLMSAYVEVLRRSAAALRVPLIDVYHALLAEANLPALVPDGVHPNAEGHELLADVVTEELLSLLPGAQKRRATEPTSPRGTNESR